MFLRNPCRSLIVVSLCSAVWLNAPMKAQSPVAAAPVASAPMAAAPAAQSMSYGDRARLGTETLQKTYSLQTGLYKTTGWWNSANAVTTLADYSRAAQTHAYDFVLSNSLDAAQKRFPGFINEYYDDEGWWVLAWVDAYEDTHDARYLDMAEAIFTDMTYGWSDTCSGGIWWSKDRKYKNAIANELFLDAASSLANVTKAQQRASYLEWAKKEWAWFSHSGMINDQHLINDGLTPDCKNNGRTVFSYNQGVVLGGLAKLSQVDRDPSLLRQANEIAKAAISELSDQDGILHDRCDKTRCGADGTQFKGVFVRNLRILVQIDPHAAQYKAFILKNADSIWSQTTADNYQLGQAWDAPFGSTDASTQSSALDVLVAAAAVSRK
jgi:predicted alpha-1,6-mannanase (GH76 family)